MQFADMLELRSVLCSQCARLVLCCAQDWHSKPGYGFLYYMFRPPWVHVRVTDTYFTLHPEDRSLRK